MFKLSALLRKVMTYLDAHPGNKLNIHFAGCVLNTVDEQKEIPTKAALERIPQYLKNRCEQKELEILRIALALHDTDSRLSSIITYNKSSHISQDDFIVKLLTTSFELKRDWIQATEILIRIGS